MNVKALLAGIALVVGGTAAPALAQDVTAEVRTWSGQSLRLGQPFLEVVYTVVPQAPEAPLLPPGEKTTAAAPTVRFAGAPSELKGLFERAPLPQQAEKQVDAVTIYRDGVARRVPLAQVASLMFFRRPVANSSLPPHVAPLHFRYAATAVLTDGSQVEGDYVSLGTAALKGATPQGTVSVPWQDIEIVRFAR
jgi:hypothetical protein